MVKANRIHDIVATNAIWLDWDSINSRITGNLIYNILPASGGAIFIEASRKTSNWIDHNILWKIKNIAISVYDSDSIQTFNNLIYPNPTVEGLSIELKHKNQASITIVDPRGQEIYVNENVNQKENINLKSFKPVIYKITQNGKQKIKRVIVR